MLFYDFDAFRADPLVFFRIWDGGMASHGGIVGLALYTLWYARRHKASWRNLCDNLVVVAPLGLFFGRLANFINGELFGRVASVPWAMQFPKELYTAPDAELSAAGAGRDGDQSAWNTPAAIEEAARSSAQLRLELAQILTPRHPSQLYEAALEGAVLFTLLWVLRTRVRLPNGVLTGVFFIAYAVLRVTGEVFREPDAPLTGRSRAGSSSRSSSC